MHLAKVLRIVVIGITALWAASAVAQQIRYFPDFTSVANLQFNGNAHQATWNSAKVLRLTDGYSGVGIFHPENSTAWFKVQQPVNKGFTTYFKFQIHTAAICCSPADGLAFVVQNAATTAAIDPTYGASGVGTTARGGGSGGLGYAGIANSLAVEFDTAQDPWDPSPNHVAVQSCGTKTNGPVHSGSWTVGSHPNTTSCLLMGGTAINSSAPAVPHLGVTDCTTSGCKDGTAHEVVIEYDAPTSGTGNGTLTVWIDPAFIPTTHTPVSTAVKAISIPYNIDNAFNSQGLSLHGGSAWVGFTASQTRIPEANDILAWEFTSHDPAPIMQTIPNGGTPATYNFGGHDTIVTFYTGFVNPPSNPYIMTVTPIPVSRSEFHKRLVGTSFEQEQCVVYLGTGGNCIVYEITCQQGGASVTCPASLEHPCNAGDTTGCINFSTSYYTQDPINANNADYLKAPIGTNNWESIFVLFDPKVLDAQTSGRGHDTSDFVATFTPTTRPQ